MDFSRKNAEIKFLKAEVEVLKIFKSVESIVQKLIRYNKLYSYAL